MCWALIHPSALYLPVSNSPEPIGAKHCAASVAFHVAQSHSRAILDDRRRQWGPATYSTVGGGGGTRNLWGDAGVGRGTRLFQSRPYSQQEPLPASRADVAAVLAAVCTVATDKSSQRFRLVRVACRYALGGGILRLRLWIYIL